MASLFKEVSQNEIKKKNLTQSEIKLKGLSQSKEASKNGLQGGISVSITKALSGVLYMMKRMLETFRPGHNYTGIFKHFPPECQQNYEYVGFSEEDEMSGKIGPVNNAWHECAGQEVVSKAVFVQAANFSNRKKAVDFMKRGTSVPPLDFLIIKGQRQRS